MTEGLSPECPAIWDPRTKSIRPESQCAQRLEVVTETKCDVKNQVGRVAPWWWCSTN